MKKVLLILSGLFLTFLILQCAGAQKPDPRETACKMGCDTNYDKCIKKSAGNEAKKAACEAVKSKCYRDCGKSS